MIKKQQKAFTLVELMVVIAVIGLLASILLVAFSGVQAKGRDAKREVEITSISKALEYHSSENGKYPVITGWVSIEEDATFSQEMTEYLSEMPEDPLYGDTSGSGEPYSYQYMSSDEGEHYAIKVVYETRGTVIIYSSPEGRTVLEWEFVSTEYFTLSLPPGWEFNELQGMDSYIGEFVGDGMRLTFDFGWYANSLPGEDDPDHIVTYETIDGYGAKIVIPSVIGDGITGVYFGDLGGGDLGGNTFNVYGYDFTSPQQETALRIFRTIEFVE